MMTGDNMQRMVRGDPIDFIVKGVTRIPPSTRRGHRGLATPIEQYYGTEVSDEVAGIFSQLRNARNARELVEAVKGKGLDELDDYEPVLTDDVLDEHENPDLGTVLSVADVRLYAALCDREKDAASQTKKKSRLPIYVPKLVNSVGVDGDVFMAKSISSPKKVRIAWDLHPDNEVVMVDDYEKWEKLFGWRKLKELPHGKNKIRELYGDQLSKDVLEAVTGSEDSSSDSSESGSSASKGSGRRSRTKPTDEVLNIATGSAHRNRSKIKAEDIYETFDDGGTIGFSGIDMLVLFPTTEERNMTDHWWVAGSKPSSDGNGSGAVAIANCNKGTYDYLKGLDEVWHIEEYLEQADDYEFQSSIGPVSMSDVDPDRVVFHCLPRSSKELIISDNLMDSMCHALPEYAEEAIYSPPTFPHSDDMVYAPLSPEDVFWLRPELRGHHNDDGEALIIRGSCSPRGIPYKKQISSDFKLYARARLSDWDFSETDEMLVLDNAAYRLDLDDGGYELVQTLAMLHDRGVEPYSISPKARWG